MRTTSKFFTVFLLFFGMGFGLRAQCPNTGQPTIMIEEVCTQTSGVVTLAIDVQSWGNVHAWDLGFCFNLPPGVTFLGVNNLVSGQIYTATSNGFTLDFGTPSNCEGFPFLRGSTIAEATFQFSGKALPGTCFDLSLCGFGNSSSSRAYKCFDGPVPYISSYTVNGCDGGACLGSGSGFANISGTVRLTNGDPMPNCKVRNSVNSTEVFTDAAGNYAFVNLPVGCASQVEIYVSKPDSPDDITVEDRDLVVDLILNGTPLTCQQMMAADVAYNGNITGLDASFLGNFINWGGSGPNIGFTGEWLFYPSYITLTCNPSGLSYTQPPLSATVNVGPFPISGVDFTGIKLGDVNLNATNKTSPEKTLSSVLEPEISPNPFFETTILQFELPEASEVQLKVYDLSGKVLLVREMDLISGEQSIELDARDWPAGMLMYDLKVGEQRHTGRLVHTR
jgi:hypothetical protein